jgi:hypothetical protein
MGVHVASEESLNNLDMLAWEIRRIQVLLKNGQVAMESLKEDVQAVLSEVEIVLTLSGLDKDIRKHLIKQKQTLKSLQSQINRKR